MEQKSANTTTPVFTSPLPTPLFVLLCSSWLPSWIQKVSVGCALLIATLLRRYEVIQESQQNLR